MRKITLLVTFMLAFVAQGYAQFPEGFEGTTFPPTGWASFIGANGAGTNQNWQRVTGASNTGDACAYVRWEDNNPNAIGEDWLVTPQFAVAAEASSLLFYHAQQFSDPYGSTYSVRVSTTSQTDHAAFTTVLAMTEADLPVLDTDGFGPRMVDLSAYIGQQVYVAFVMANDDGDNWFIDDVSMVEEIALPSCASNPTPADAAVNVPVGIVTFSWDAPTTGDAPTAYKLFYGIDPGNVTFSLGTVTTTSVDLNILDYNFTFYWKVVPTNAAGDAEGCPVWSFTTVMPDGGCTNAPYGVYPEDAFVPVICDGVSEEVIDDFCYSGEYSIVSVTSGQTYQFLSYNDVTSDFITIANANGILVSGPSPLTWVSTVTEDVEFYSHNDELCTYEDEGRIRSVICGAPSEAAPDWVSLQWPATIEIEQGQSEIVYGQVYEAGLTDVEPGLSGQAGDITAWVGVSASNTDPATWAPAAWQVADFNAAHVSNNDEYMLAIGGNLEPGTYYYATRFRLADGGFVYGGIFPDAMPDPVGGIWDGTQYVNGVLVVTPAPAPVNDECAGAIALTPAGTFEAGAITSSNINATTDGFASCMDASEDNVWFSVVVPASGSITIETQQAPGSPLNDTIIEVFDACGGNSIGCNDENDVDSFSIVELTGLTPGSTIYVSVWRFWFDFFGGFGSPTGTFRIAAYDASLSNGGFNRDAFSFHPNPVKDMLNLSYNEPMTSVAVYNLLGQQVLTKSLNTTEAQLDLSALAKGAYIVKVAAGNDTKSVKVIKE